MFHNNLSHEGFSQANGPASNQTLWSYTTAGRIWSSPAVVNGLLFVGSFDKNIYAIGASTTTAPGTTTYNYTYIIAAVVIILKIIAAAVLFLTRHRKQK